ncbi:MAG: Polyketide cyclase / dehydrase and lipid transport [Gaiellaceae bacterium]|nr:Polyketide cyclase / dehydrase and lipid transport [Gaiellaceae bacterium]
MPRASASRELLASREDVWAFIAEPHHFPDWWPGVGGVEPGRRGLVEGARWQLRGINRPTFARRAASSGMLLVRAARRPERFAWTLTGDHLDAELQLDEREPQRTLATLVIEAPWLYGLSRALPRRALTRLHSLCQTGAEL